MNENLYYTPPPDEQFTEVKKMAVMIWARKDATKNYIDEKIGRSKDLQNVGDNFMYIVAMFDLHNQALLASFLTSETKKSIRDRMIVGGAEKRFIVF